MYNNYSSHLQFNSDFFFIYPIFSLYFSMQRQYSSLKNSNGNVEHPFLVETLQAKNTQ